MAKWKCLACGGTYDDTVTDAGGTYEYYHVCPPVTGTFLKRPVARDERIIEEKEGNNIVMEKDQSRKGMWRARVKIAAEGKGRVKV